MSLFNLSNRSKHTNFDFSFLHTDMHSHLIPGVDDGSPDLDTSLALIKRLKSCGYKKLITTPHIFKDYYPNKAETLQPGYMEVKHALKEANINIEFQAAAEYFLDTHVMDLLDNDVPLLTISENKVLTEFSMMNQPMHRDELLFKLRVKGYEPVIAHVERYTYYHQQFEQYRNLFDNGFALQLNILSLSGIYGKKVRKAAYRLLDEGLVKYLGTDLHHSRHASALEKILQDHKLMKKLEAYPWDNPKL